MNQPTNSNLNNYGICDDWRHVPATQVTEWLISMGLATARRGSWRALRLIIQTIKWNVFIYQDLKHKSFAQALQLIMVPPFYVSPSKSTLKLQLATWTK
jgi:hypothetical protein